MKKLCFRFKVMWCRGDVGGKSPPNDLFRQNLAVHFRLPVKKLRFRFEGFWCRGDVGGKSSPNDFPQELPSSAL